MNRIGKCPNLSGCLLAYRGERITVAAGEFKCPECGTPLQPVEGEEPPLSAGRKTGALAGIALILLLVIGVVFFIGRPARKPQPAPQVAEETPAPVAATPAVEPAPRPAGPPTDHEAAATPATAEPEVRRAIAVQAEETPNLDLADAQNRAVKAEVLKRIDLMPTISADNKDKLYMSVERARKMGRLLTIPFKSGNTSVGAAEIAALREITQQAQIQELLADPTAVLVVLGFADTRGDEQKNIKISEQRADNVLRVLRDRCGIINVMHAVGMGGSTLFDPAGTEKNRVAEVWVVLP